MPIDCALQLLAEVAALMLEGRPRSTDADGAIRAPLPRYVAACLKRLADKHQPYPRAADFRLALRGLRNQPVAVTRQRRLIHLAVLMSLGVMASGLGVGTLLGIDVFYPPLTVTLMEKQQKKLAEVSARDLAVALLQPEAPAPGGVRPIQRRPATAGGPQPAHCGAA